MRLQDLPFPYNSYKYDDSLITILGLTDYTDKFLDLNKLPTRSQNALKRALMESGLSFDETTKPIKLEDISHLAISDITDQKNVGINTFVDLIDEIRKNLVPYVENISIIPEHDLDTTKAYSELDQIFLSPNLEELVEGMFHYISAKYQLNSEFSNDERTLYIWKNRLPWYTDKPIQLEIIGKKYGITRERVRQIQFKENRFKLNFKEKLPLFSQLSDLLLTTSTYLDFQKEIFEEEMTRDKFFNIGRIRFIALRLGDTSFVEEIESAFYKWSKIN